MAIIAGLAAAAGRFAGDVVTTLLGWASMLLFGRVPRSSQLLLSLVTLGSLAWVAMLAGVAVPSVGTLLLAAVPAPSFIDRGWIRLAMLAGAVVTPLLMGVGTLILLEPARRPHGPRGIALQLLRGYPLALVLAGTLALLAAVGLVRKVRSLSRGWTDEHLPIVVKPGGYERLVDDVQSVLDLSGRDLDARPASAILAAPARLVATIAGPGVRQLVPDRLTALVGAGLEVAIYPSDVAISGKAADVARARAAIVSALSSSAAYLTTSAEAQALEDKLRRVGTGSNGRRGARPAQAGRIGDFGPIDAELASLDVPSDEWETLYRVRLQLERDLLAGEAPGRSFPGRQVAPTSSKGIGEGRGNTAGRLRSLAGVAAIALIALDLVMATAERLRPARM
ncbi:MAG TPA: hypothetical protein VIV06_09230 [Candidatus Limnocylindrales bacterium]